MKFRINFRIAFLLTIAFAASLTFNSCKDDDDKKNCEGYTGEVTNADAKNLLKLCHFIEKDTIKDWVGRYEKYRELLGRKQDYKTNNQNPVKADEMTAAMDEMSARFLKGGSVSFNSCIIKKILCNKNSIGLRVLYGIDRNNRIHIILVGINPDYTNLYVFAEDCCPEPLNKALGAGLTSPTAPTGGAEYGQMP